MRHIATAALIFHFGVAVMNAQSGPEKTTVSGTSAFSTISLRPDAPTSEYHLTGNSTLGRFDLRTISVSTPSPQQSGPCSASTNYHLSVVAGAGVFRFENGSLLTAVLTGGDDCIDFSAGQAVCIRILQVTGGTGRFKDAVGSTVTLTMTVVPVVGDASNNPVFFAVTGDITGAVAGVATDQGSQDGQK